MCRGLKGTWEASERRACAHSLDRTCLFGTEYRKTLYWERDLGRRRWVGNKKTETVRMWDSFQRLAEGGNQRVIPWRIHRTSNVRPGGSLTEPATWKVADKTLDEETRIHSA